MDGIQIVVFGLNDETCGVDTSQVREIIKFEKLTKMPQMPKFIDGVINIRGSVVPVVNLNKRFELGEMEITKKAKIIITEIDTKQVGFLVNDVFEIYKLESESIETTPKLIQKVDNAYLKSVGKKDEKLISILDLEAILTDLEIKKLEESKITADDEEETEIMTEAVENTEVKENTEAEEEIKAEKKIEAKEDTESRGRKGEKSKNSAKAKKNEKK